MKLSSLTHWLTNQLFTFLHLTELNCTLKSQSQSQSYFTTGGLPPISSSWWHAPREPRPVFSLQLNTCDYSPYVTYNFCWSSASAVILRSESCRTHDHNLLSQIRDSPNLEGQVPVFISPRNRVVRLYSPGTGFPFHSFLRLEGLRWRYSNPHPRGVTALSL
jgi:hypothetical protein